MSDVEKTRRVDAILVTAKRLDSDEVEETSHELGPSVPTGSEAEIRSQLATAVSRLYPEAEFRSYADGTITYLAPKWMIVAVYRPAEPSGHLPGDNDTQQQLFAA